MIYFILLLPACILFTGFIGLLIITAFYQRGYCLKQVDTFINILAFNIEDIPKLIKKRREYKQSHYYKITTDADYFNKYFND